MEWIYLIPLFFIYMELRDCAKHLRKLIEVKSELLKEAKFVRNNP